jgi:membrane protease YdiL (CAAX protease family)
VPVAVAATIAVVAYGNLVALAGLPTPVYVVVNLAAAALAVLAAVRGGIPSGALGLGRDAVRPGLHWAGIQLTLIVIGLGVGLAVLRDRFPTLGVPSGHGALAFDVLVRIPFGTALPEEMLFRGVVLALWTRAVSLPAAAGITSAAFGLWHIGATVATLGDDATVLTVAGAVAFTTMVGLVLAWGRFFTGGVWGPAVAHAAANGLATLAGAIARSLE